MKKELVTNSILTAIFLENKTDYLDLVRPFVENAIYDLYNKKDVINLHDLLDKIRVDYHLVKFPIKVLETILRRIAKEKKIDRNNNEYRLIYDFQSERDSFSSKKVAEEKSVMEIILNIKQFMKELLKEELSVEQVGNHFISFIAKQGYDIFLSEDFYKVYETENRYLYSVGRYINDAYENDKAIFNKILRIVEGYMISNAIYLQVDIKNKKFLREMKVYLDSPFVLRLLNLKTEIENNAANELLQLIRLFGSKVYLFEHNFEEICRVLSNYKNKNKGMYRPTIEYFDEKKYSNEQVDEYIVTLESKVNKLGIKIVPKPEFDERFILDEEIIYDNLKAKLPFKTNTRAAEVDLESVKAIHTLRRGKNYPTIESCKFVFITTYNEFKKITNYYREDKGYNFIGPILTDFDLTTILWFKNMASDDELPKLKLLENALAVIEPTALMKQKAMDIMKEMDKNGGTTIGVSEKLTLQFLTKNDYFHHIKNDESCITKESIEKFILDDFTEKIETRKEIEKYKNWFSTHKEDYNNKIEKRSNILHYVIYYGTNILMYAVLFIILYFIFNFFKEFEKKYQSSIISFIVAVSLFAIEKTFRKIPFIDFVAKELAFKVKLNYIKKKTKKIDKIFDIL